jgi:subtilisin
MGKKAARRATRSTWGSGDVATAVRGPAAPVAAVVGAVVGAAPTTEAAPPKLFLRSPSMGGPASAGSVPTRTGPANFPRIPAALQQAASRQRIVVFRPGSGKAGAAFLRDRAGLKLASTADAASGALDPGQVKDAGGVIFDKLNAAVITGEPDQLRLAAGVAGGPLIAASSTVRVLVAISQAYGSGPSGRTASAGDTAEYLRGYRDGILSMAGGGATGPGRPVAPPVAAAVHDETEATWGLQVTGVLNSKHTGEGVKVAVLDTGIALGHPDFVGRVVASQSFVPGVTTAEDGHGHGTHVAGTACGPLQPTRGPRYGVAPGAQLYVAKVLGDDGFGLDPWFLAGLNWSLTQRCRIANMSLAGEPGASYDLNFEYIVQAALEQGMLVVGAAGNESNRALGDIRPVDHPANCPSILAVAAVDAAMNVANFSNAGYDPREGQIDIAGPGVDVLSAWPPDRTLFDSGTSMAAPHVTGIAALYAQAFPTATARELWTLLTTHSRRLNLPSADVGAGLVTAP